jgi:DNA-binding beta-propeller fold protein YncE
MPFFKATHDVEAGGAQAPPKSTRRFLAAVVPAALLLSASVFSFAAPAASSKDAGQAPVAGSAMTMQPISATEALPVGGPSTRFIPQTEPQASHSTMNTPLGLAVDTTGKIYVANLFGNNVTIYGKNLKLEGTISTGLNLPAAVGLGFGVGLGDTIYVANNGGSNITVYNSSLAQTGTITDSTLVNPYSMYVDANDDIWVLDATGTTHLYLDNGTPISSVNVGGTAVGPMGSNVAVWGVSYGGGIDTFIGNVGLALHYGIGFQYAAGPTWQAGAAAEDLTGLSYSTDLSTNQVLIAQLGVGTVGAIATPSEPYGIAVDPINQRIYVSQPNLNEVLVYNLKSPYKLLGTIK